MVPLPRPNPCLTHGTIDPRRPRRGDQHAAQNLPMPEIGGAGDGGGHEEVLGAEEHDETIDGVAVGRGLGGGEVEHAG